MGDPYKGKVAGHALRYGGRSVYTDPHSRQGIPRVAECECGARSKTELPTIAARRQWHREHKADRIDTFVARGVDDRGREVHP